MRVMFNLPRSGFVVLVFGLLLALPGCSETEGELVAFELQHLGGMPQSCDHGYSSDTVRHRFRVDLTTGLVEGTIRACAQTDSQQIVEVGDEIQMTSAQLDLFEDLVDNLMFGVDELRWADFGVATFTQFSAGGDEDIYYHEKAEPEAAEGSVPIITAESYDSLHNFLDPLIR